MELQTLIPIFTAIAGALLGAGVNNNFQNKRIIKEQKAQLLKDLMATRFDSPSDQKAAEAINYIPVLFYDQPAVLTAWSKMHLVMKVDNLPRSEAFTALLVEIAKDIGITFNPAHLMEGPIFSHERMLRDQVIKKEFAKAQNELREKAIKNANT